MRRSHPSSRSRLPNVASGGLAILSVTALVGLLSYGHCCSREEHTPGHSPVPSAVPVKQEPAVTEASSGGERSERLRVASRDEDVAPVAIVTYADGLPVPTLLVDAGDAGPLTPMWKQAVSSHVLPDSGDDFVVLHQGSLAVLLRRSELPGSGVHRVDLERAPELDVRLVNVPSGLRERMNLQLQMGYDDIASEAENRASCLLRDRAPIPMNEDRVLVPLGLSRRGSLRVFAKSRHSNISYATPKAAFEPISQVIEIDVGVLAPARDLASLALVLDFPFPYPDGEFDVCLTDGSGSTLTCQRRERGDASECVFEFFDLPRARLTPEVRFGRGRHPRILLDTIDLTGGDASARREVVAESRLRVVLAGGDQVPPKSKNVLVRDAGGATVAKGWPVADEYTFERLPAGVYFVQALSYDARLASPVTQVDVRMLEECQVSLPLHPAAEVLVAPEAFDSVPYLDVHYAVGDVSRVFLDRGRSIWLPVGMPDVRWESGRSQFRVEPGVRNEWGR